MQEIKSYNGPITKKQKALYKTACKKRGKSEVDRVIKATSGYTDFESLTESQAKEVVQKIYPWLAGYKTI